MKRKVTKKKTADQILKEHAARNREIFGSAGIGPVSPLVVHTVRACIEDGKWSFTGDAVTEDGLFGSRDAVGCDDLKLPLKATPAEVRQAVETWIFKEDGMRLAGDEEFDFRVISW